MGRLSAKSVRCTRCKVLAPHCICDVIVPLDLATKVVLVAHRIEIRKPTATGPLALECLPNSQLFVQGVEHERIDLAPLFEEGRRVLCLYPGDGARVLTPELAAEDPRPITLVVPDGTWSQASRIVKRVPGIERAEKVVLPEGRPTEWGIREESKLAGLATFEAIARSLAILEGEHVSAPLERVFGAMVAATIRGRGYAPELHKGEATQNAPTHQAPLDIVHLDEHLVAISKPSGMIVHRGWSNDPEPALQRLRNQLGRRVYPVHRLDRSTSGVVLFAFESGVARQMQELFEEGLVEKRYLALSRGRRATEVTIDHPLAKEGGELRPAVTDVRLLGHFERYGLYEAIPRTGRTHQIRRHFKHLHQPLIGDTRYGTGAHNRLFREYGFHRLALHATELRFVHPKTGENVRIRAPLAPEFATLLEKLGLLEVALS